MAFKGILGRKYSSPAAMPQEHTGVTEMKTKSIYTLAREKTVERSKKFSCEFSEEVRDNGGYTMNCYYFGCIHQIDHDCPIVKESK